MRAQWGGMEWGPRWMSRTKDAVHILRTDLRPPESLKDD